MVITAYRSPDTEKHRQVSAIVKMCREAGIYPPQQVLDYYGVTFEGDINPDGMIPVSIPQAVTRYQNDYQEGYDIALRELPKDIDVIRCVISNY